MLRKRSGLPESVVIKHHLIVIFLQEPFPIAPNDFIYPCTHASLGRDLTRIALATGLKHPNLTPYSMRRRGATWLFKSTLNYGTMSRTTVAGHNLKHAGFTVTKGLLT